MHDKQSRLITSGRNEEEFKRTSQIMDEFLWEKGCSAESFKKLKMNQQINDEDSRPHLPLPLGEGQEPTS